MKIERKNAPLVDPREEREKRERLATVRVLIADRNARTASLVRGILFSFGFRTMDIVTSGAEALALLASEPFDLIITEWNMAPVDGIELVRAIRTAKDDQRIRRDIPIIMLTARTEINSVEAARDAGITEFLAKPFSAKTMSARIIQIIDTPRAFIETPGYVGPCRRRRQDSPGGLERRMPPELRQQLTAGDGSEKIFPPDHRLGAQMQPFSGGDILDEKAVVAAQDTLQQAEGEFVEWAKDYIAQLDHAYTALCAAPADKNAMQALREAAYAITSQAGIFGYDMGTQVGEMLTKYLGIHPQANAKTLVVIRKHIDTVNAIFTQKIKENGQEVGAELLASLRKLIVKLN